MPDSDKIGWLPVLLESPSGETCLPAGRWYTRMYYVYILQSIETSFFYKGLTDNIDRRIKEHFAGKNKFTKRHLPMRLIHAEICDNRSDARMMEKFFKSGFGREIIKELAENAN